MPALTAMPCDGLAGHLVVPGDKSISHRALMLGAVAVGETRITGLLAADDVLRTARAVVELGAEVETAADGTWHVQGRGVGGLQAPSAVLDLGNAGTAARLLLGLLASHPLRATLTGDASLRSRPMERVAAPLRQIGAEIRARPGCRLPLTITGTVEPLPIRYRLPVASAQVKSAVLLAGLNTPGETIVEEPEPTRDHSERMLSHFGAQIAVDQVKGVREIRLAGQPELAGATITVPGDPSSAAYAAVAATVLPGSEILLEAIGVNPLRTGVFETLTDMGADIAFENHREAGGEPVADLRVRAAALHGVAVPAERAPRMIDEYPILAVAAACAEGRTEMTGLDELRVKESDRLAAIARGLAACGVKVEEGPDSLAVVGPGGRPPGGNTAPIATQLDHRIAMSFLILGLAAEKAVTVDNAEPIATSFPDFAEALASLGAAFTGGARP